MNFLTDFADQAVVLPVVLTVAIVLAVQGGRRGALVWLAVVACTFGALVMLKAILLACGPVFHPWALQSPSGHTAAASVVAGGFATILGGRAPVVLGASLAAAALIGLSRIELGVHSIPEVVLGAAVGAAGALVLARAERSPAVRPVPLLTASLAVALLLHGVHLPAEGLIWRVAHHRLDFLLACRENAAEKQ